MDLKRLLTANRSYRRFRQEKSISPETLRDLVDLARLAPSGRNLQPLKFVTVHEPDECEKVFSCLAWAGYLRDGAPKEGERPSAYIVICNDRDLAAESKWDQGIVAQTLMLGSVERGLGGCIVAAIRKRELSELLSLPERLEPVVVLALGHPCEKVVLTEAGADGIRYYRDENGVHYVPKRPLDEILIR